MDYGSSTISTELLRCDNNRQYSTDGEWYIHDKRQIKMSDTIHRTRMAKYLTNIATSDEKSQVTVYEWKNILLTTIFEWQKLRKNVRLTRCENVHINPIDKTSKSKKIRMTKRQWQKLQSLNDKNPIDETSKQQNYGWRTIWCTDCPPVKTSERQNCGRRTVRTAESNVWISRLGVSILAAMINCITDFKHKLRWLAWSIRTYE